MGGIWQTDWGRSIVGRRIRKGRTQNIREAVAAWGTGGDPALPRVSTM